jgi:hypothetical protein
LALGTLASFQVAQMYSMRNQTNQVDLQTAARSIADLFAREVRRAGTLTNPNCLPPSCTPASCGTASTGILLASSSQIRIRADLNANGALTDANEDVTYTLDSSNNKIKRVDNNVSHSEADNTLWSGTSISGSQITYFDSNGTQLVPGGTGLTSTQLLQVMRVKLALKLTAAVVQPLNTLQQTATDGADAEVRNRFFLMSSCGPTPAPTNVIQSYN